MHAETSFVRNLGDLIRARKRSGPVHEGKSYTMNMHADEKSDEGIRPEKWPNKRGKPLAEAVEERTSPEGNGGQTAADWTLSQGTASNGLAAVLPKRRNEVSRHGSRPCCITSPSIF